MMSQIPDHYPLNAEEFAFLKTQTGTQDDDHLKAHVLAVQKAAYKVYAYPCIRRFGFARPAYEHVLTLGRNIPGALLLDMGCCFGNDLRRIASDGFPVQNMIASDLRQEEPRSPVPPLSALRSLNPPVGRLSAIHSASLFYLFSEAKQLELACKLAGLLSPRPGSIIFGCHLAHPTKSYILGPRKMHMICHSPDSWREMWDGMVFARGPVEVCTHLKNLFMCAVAHIFATMRDRHSSASHNI
ncbi:hypothetical protein C8R43DRAFT_1094356 [Mycena crocata]|nr:hypothetical protein C8R43DRAFT_1094356 [Mycena crocata]